MKCVEICLYVVIDYGNYGCIYKKLEEIFYKCVFGVVWGIGWNKLLDWFLIDVFDWFLLF